MNSRMLDSPYDELPITAAPHAGGGMITIRNAIAASFILIVALASQAHAEQSNAQKFFRAFGVGRDNCGEFIQAAENSPSATRNPDPKYGEFIGFIAGFLTGADWVITANNPGNLGYDNNFVDAILWLENYCRQNPFAPYASAIQLMTAGSDVAARR
jgi:hypothetical protein